MSAVQAVEGFSLINRWLLYTSFMLAPAQFISGIGSNCPSNIGFLAYNWYTQLTWYKAIKANELHALSLLPVHFNFIFVFTYLGGVTSGNLVMGVILGLGTAGVIILNTVAAWTAWAIDQPGGFGEYQFFFFGWRTLSPGWHKFILVWQIGDSLFAFGSVVTAMVLAITTALSGYGGDEDEDQMPWWTRYPAMPLGAVAMLLFGWPLILWTELIVSRNHIESDTDMIAVWLFVAQVGTMLIPSCTSYLGCFKGMFQRRQN
ncbi:hypothetical protein NUU61_006315 [Penicillium alfredii]|uniref:Uncharacterized protein n=1 Tax=Penicillium alfredii TaxID=1506179 RepID=A0A9W9F0Q2_9EURO|nr:uncharacterized protein NUU61_006315 [Penicillium alfredii]KAJ5091445.1 hypothetical protein NUU61_006315 [Penicillium alfredii]